MLEIEDTVRYFKYFATGVSKLQLDCIQTSDYIKIHFPLCDAHHTGRLVTGITLCQSRPLGDVMSTMMKTTNLIRSRALNHQEFCTFLSEIDAQFREVTYHSVVCWLSRGTVLERFYSLISETDCLFF